MNFLWSQGLFKHLFSLFAVFAFSAGVTWAQETEREPRLALVVGNALYGQVAPLDNPVNDANLIANTLKDLGFTVTLATDLRQVEMKRAIAQFGRDLRAAGSEATGLFYYAGHGVQSFGNNYLLPVDVALADAADLDLMAVEAQSVLRQMGSARNRTNLVILDACRNNPFENVADLDESGLAEMKAPTGTFLAYATAPGSVALDGQRGNSPFTQALAHEIVVPGQPVEQAFKAVRRTVLAHSGGQQTPWDTSSLVSDFVFVDSPAAPVLSPAETEELQLWQSVRATRDPVQLMLFLRGYPEGAFTNEARALLSAVMEEELGGGSSAPVPPSVEPDTGETAMFTAAQQDGSVTGYEAYLQSYPDGTYAEIARTEIAALQAGQAQDPAGAEPSEEVTAEVAETPESTPKQAEAGPVTFVSPLVSDLAQISGLSLAEIVEQSPMFPPIEGLPESYWKTETCSSCHEWTRDRLCTQANTYLSLNMQRSLNKQHPFGGVMKRSLKSWAAGGCQ
ncbi:caspase family protein [Pseudophaeobacter sp.]|uniref:caspase family protein n=1 Tax=Pseudophaeobacter sp. TaxID=1971739 RepID=UPI003A97AD7D